MDPTQLSPLTAGNAAAAAPQTNPTANADAAKKAGEDFESFFLSQNFDTMFSNIGTDPMFGGGNGESVYRSLLVQQYAKVAAQSDSTGIADAVQREILNLQETQG